MRELPRQLARPAPPAPAGQLIRTELPQAPVGLSGRQSRRRRAQVAKQDVQALGRVRSALTRRHGRLCPSRSHIRTTSTGRRHRLTTLSATRPIAIHTPPSHRSAFASTPLKPCSPRVFRKAIGSLECGLLVRDCAVLGSELDADHHDVVAAQIACPWEAPHVRHEASLDSLSFSLQHDGGRGQRASGPHADWLRQHVMLPFPR